MSNAQCRMRPLRQAGSLRNQRRLRRPSGVIMVIMLLAVMLLAGLIFYVLNMGQQTNGRVVTQNSADATAAAGAGWIARQFNTVAMNNVGIAHLLTADCFLDTYPMAVDFTLQDQVAIHNALASQRAQVTNIPFNDWAVQALYTGGNKMVEDLSASPPHHPLLTEINNEINRLLPISAALTDGTYGGGNDPALVLAPDFANPGLQTFDIGNATLHTIGGATVQNQKGSQSSGTGAIWRAIEAMDFYSQASMDNLGAFAQVNAAKGGANDLAVGGGGQALLVPVLPNVPVIRGSFDDFERPVKNGLLPPKDANSASVSRIAVDDGSLKARMENRGPWDALFGWWRLEGQTSMTISPGSFSTGAGGFGSDPILGNVMATQGGQPWSWFTGPPDRYIVWGPFEQELYKWYNFRWRYLIYSRFAERDDLYRDYWKQQRNGWLDQIVVNKLAYLWPPPPKFIEDSRRNLRCRGYKNGVQKLDIPITKPYTESTGDPPPGGVRGWFDGPNMQIDTHPSKDYYLEDGVNATSNDLVLRLEDLGDGTTQVTYISQATASWTYDVLDPDGNVVLSGLGQGANGARVGNYFTAVPTPPYTIRKPQWITDYNQAAALANPSPSTTGPSSQPALPPAHITETLYVHVGMKSAIPPGAAGFLTEGTWVYIQSSYSNGRKGAEVMWPRSVNGNGWVDMERRVRPPVPVNPNNPNPPPVEPSFARVGDFIWLSVRVGYELADPEIGLLPEMDSDGKPVKHPVYVLDEYVFVGANIGNIVDIRNPFNTGRHEDLPVAYDLDHTKVTTDVKDRRQYLSFLGVAHRSDTALLAPTKFSGNKPYSNMVGLAQAQVFNNHSFDLWTPMWTAQVEMISDYPDWVTTLESGISDAGSIPDGVLTDADLTNLAKYLRANEGLAKISLTH